MKKQIKYPHTDKMTLIEWKEWFEEYNLDALRDKDKNRSVKEFLLKYKDSDFVTFIYCSFYFDETKKGFSYWNNIARRNQTFEK